MNTLLPNQSNCLENCRHISYMSVYCVKFTILVVSSGGNL